MVSDTISAARMIVEEALHAAGLNPHDFRLRDKVILSISGTIDGMLNYAQSPDASGIDRTVAVSNVETSSEASGNISPNTYEKMSNLIL